MYKYIYNTIAFQGNKKKHNKNKEELENVSKNKNKLYECDSQLPQL